MVLVTSSIFLAVSCFEVLDKNTNLLQALNDKTPLTVLEAEGRMAFRIVLNRPSPLAKYVVLTFVKKQPAD